MSIQPADTTGDQAQDDNFVDQNKDKMTLDRVKQLVKENFFSGVTVALVSIPLSSALAMAQGATAMMGLSTAIFGPGIGGILGGSHYNILGPAGALVNIVSTLSAVNGQEIIPLVAFWGGVMSFMVYALKMEQYCTMLPTSVLEGFSLGVATSIGLGQFDFAFGLYGLPKHKRFFMNVFEGFEDVDQMQEKEFFPFLVFFITLMSLLKWKPQIPWIIVIAILGIVYGAVMKECVADKTLTPVLLKDIYPKMATDVQLANFSYWDKASSIKTWNIIVGAFKVSFVAVLETLISGRIADNKTNTRFDQSKEIFGMSIANVVAGLLGGTPCTGVLIRTNVNIQTKATHKTSQFINAVVVLLIVVFLSPIFTYIPMSVIASILVTSSCRLIPMKVMKDLWQCDKFEFWLLIVTWLICVFKDGAIGLIMGSFLSFLKLSKKTDQAEMKIDYAKIYRFDGQGDHKVMDVELKGSLNYINTVHFETAIFDAILSEEPQYVCIHYDAVFIDIDGLISCKNIERKMNGNVALVIKDCYDDSVMAKSWWYQDMKSKNMVFASVNEAHTAFEAFDGDSNQLDQSVNQTLINRNAL